MFDGEIYRKAVTIAVHNGFNFGMSSSYTKEEIIDALTIDFDSPDPYVVIYNHHFAKAFWGNEETCPYCGGNEIDDGNEFGIVCCADCGDISGACTYPWQFYLQQMVIKENPIQYLEQFLDNPKGETNE